MLTREGPVPPEWQGRRVSAARPVIAIRGQELPWRAAPTAVRPESGGQERELTCQMVPQADYGSARRGLDPVHLGNVDLC
jgi:hypothetical protein